MLYRAVLVGVVMGCGSSQQIHPGDAGADAASSDAPADAAPDAPPDAACPTAGTPTLLSTATPPLTRWVQLAGNGTSTMALWQIGGHSAWAEYDASGVVGHGDTNLSGTLLAVGSQYVVVNNTTIDTFDGSTWTERPFQTPMYAVSGSSLGGIGIVYDGTSVIGPTMITQHRALAIGGDGQGGFAVVTSDDSGATSANLALITYDGTSWSNEVAIGAASEGSSYFLDTTVVPYNGSWAVMWNVDGNVNIAIESNGTWSTRSFLNTGSDNYAMAVNGTTLAVVGNAGFAATFKNGAWTRHDLTTVVADYGYPPMLAAFGAGFVTVYGEVEIRGAVFDGTSWGSDVQVTSRSGARFFRLAVSADTAVVSFVEEPTPSVLVPKLQTFSGGSWGAPVQTGAADSLLLYNPAAIAVESDGIRTAYIEPGTAVTMLESAGTWSAPDDIPVTPTSGEVLTAAIGHASNGHALLAWEQVDADQNALFAAEYDGEHWGAPVLLAMAKYLWGPSVAATGSTFVIGWGYGPDEVGYPVAGGHLARWTGSGVGPLTTVAGTPALAADDASFVAVTGTINSGLTTMTSTDGNSWTSSASGPYGSVLAGLAGGPAGVIAITWLDSSSYTVEGWVWHGGAWSTPGMLMSGNYLCQASVGTTSAVAVCPAPMGVQDAVFANGSWTFSSMTTTPAPAAEFRLGTDGSDYRLDIGASTGTSSTVLHNGTWSPIITDPGIAFPDTVSAICGQWTGTAGAQHDVITATGGSPYAIDHATGLPASAQVVPGAHRLDAFWIAPAPSSNGQAVLSVQLGL